LGDRGARDDPAAELESRYAHTVWMIESRYWKEELKRIAATVRRSKAPPRWSERAHCVVERDIMLGAFMVRRLMELHKVSSRSRNLVMEVFSCPTRRKNVTRMNHHRLEEMYDLANERCEAKKAVYVCNQLIHAYTSFVARDETRNWSDVYAVSDFDRNDCIWRIPILEIHRLFKEVGKDYSHTFRMVYNPKKRDYDVSTN
jgi:hypothetical protein